MIFGHKVELPPDEPIWRTPIAVIDDGAASTMQMDKQGKLLVTITDWLRMTEAGYLMEIGMTKEEIKRVIEELNKLL